MSYAPLPPGDDEASPQESKGKSSSGAMGLGAGIVLLMVVSFGLKAMRAYQKNANNNPPAPTHYTPPPRPVTPPLPSTPLPVPAAGEPVVEGSRFDLSGWSVQTFAAGGFRIYVPGDPKITVIGNDKNKQQDPGETMTWQLKEQKVTLLAQYQGDVDSPLAALFENFEQSTLDGSIKAIGAKAKNLEFTRITLRGTPGRDATWTDAKETEHIHGRLFARGGRRYMLLAIADETHKDDAALGAFLDSFDFVGK